MGVDSEPGRSRADDRVPRGRAESGALRRLRHGWSASPRGRSATVVPSRTRQTRSRGEAQMTVEAQEPRIVRTRSRRNAGAPPPPPAIHWHEGMLLAPQHFQSASLREEVVAYYHTSAVSPFHWGLMSLDSSLSEGIVTVRSVEAVMPDGLLVRYPGGGAVAYHGAAGLAFDLKKHEDDVRKGKQTLYLAVASNQDGRQLSERFDLTAKEKVPDDTN